MITHLDKSTTSSFIIMLREATHWHIIQMVQGHLTLCGLLALSSVSLLLKGLS